MRHYVLPLILVAICLVNLANAAENGYRDIYPDTWVATDAIGRKMPSHSQVGPLKDDHRRTVGIFYITWHRDSAADAPSPYTADVTKILKKDPSARLDGDHPLWKYSSYHWGEPEVGYFLSKDEYVIRKDMSMLADAGVDVLIMDVTNGVRYWDEWHTVFPIMQKMKAEGNKVPKFCFWAFNGGAISVAQDLYERIYKNGKYKDLWFHWDGKPLLLYNDRPSIDATGTDIKNKNPNYEPEAAKDPNHPHYGNPYYTKEYLDDYTEEIKDFFTLRTMWWGYYKWHGERFVGTEDNWSFGYDLGNENVKAMDPDDLVSTHNGVKEEAAVTPAQHPVSLTGKSWTRENGEPELNKYDLPVPTYVPWLGKKVDNPEAYGIYFQNRWDEAIKSDPKFIYINDWNEWTAGKYPLSEEIDDFMRRNSHFMFVDQYNSEFNRGIQPMKDGYTDNYYMQMAQNIRRYKGARPIPALEGLSDIDIDADFSDWTDIETEYRDTIGDISHRDYPGYGGLHYTNNSGRNDIITSKVAVDDENIYFYVETDEPLTEHTDDNWMLLLIDADKDHDTGWYGYDILINKSVEGDEETTLMRYEKEKWTKAGQLDYRYNGKSMEIAVPGEMLGLEDDSFTFDFHWCDNPKELENPISLCTHGDSAPNRRFNYRCIWKK